MTASTSSTRRPRAAAPATFTCAWDADSASSFDISAMNYLSGRLSPSLLMDARGRCLQRYPVAARSPWPRH